jgi:hypothetical protein
MNLKQKEDLRNRLLGLTELLSCVDPEFTYEHSEIVMSESANRLLGNLIGLTCHGDKRLALNFLLRMLKDVTNQVRFELE